MVVLNRIYTRAGDKGKTRLATGAARLKCDLRVEAYGTVDETNACVGLARLHTKNDARLDAMLAREGRLELAQACFEFLPTRARLDLQGWDTEDIFAHT